MDVISENLTFTYGKDSKTLSFKALNGISLTVKEGEFLGIIGKTGSGKSTFVQHLNGLIKIQKNSGGIIRGEYDLSDKKCDFRALRAKIGMMFQYPEHQLFAETVEEDVAFALKNFQPELNEEERKKRVYEALSLTGLDPDKIKDLSPFDLSGGQKRRVAIAGVLVAKPEILILDEPAAGLDPPGKKTFLELLVNIHKTFAKTIIIVSHDMDLVAEYCSMVAVLKDGKLAAHGTPEEVFGNADAVKDCGLDLPLTAKIKETLAKRGMKITGDLTVNGFIDGVIRALKGEKL